MATSMWIGYSLVALFFLYIFIAIEVDSRLQKAEYEAFYAQFYRSTTDDDSGTTYPVDVHRRRDIHNHRCLPRRYSLTVK